MSTSPTSMSAAAAQYQESISKYQPRRSSSTVPLEAQPVLGDAPAAAEPGTMDIKQESLDQSAPAVNSQSSTPAPVPVVDTAALTPKQVNGEVKTGGTTTDTASAIPSQPVEHGAPFRRYINAKVTPSLLEGMKELGLKQPKDPLKFLGEFLLEKSKELEGTGS